MERLQVLLRLTRALTAERKLDDIIHGILQAAVEVIPAADAGVLFLYDPKSGRLTVNHAIGFGPAMSSVSVAPSEGLAGRAFITGRGAIYPDLSTVKAVMGGITEENQHRFSEATGGIEYPQSALTAALVYQGQPLGSMVVENLYTPKVFDDFDLRLLEALAQAAAVAIVNARLYESERDTRLRLEALNEEIGRQRDQLERRLRVQESLSEVVRDSLSLEVLANKLGRLAGCTAWILDSFHRMRAASGEGTTGWDDSWIVALRLAERAGHHQVALAGGGSRLVERISAASDLLGFVCAEWSNRQPDGIDRAAVEHAVLIAAAQFLRERAAEEGEIHRRSDLIDRLLGGQPPAASLLGSDLRPPLGMAVGTPRQTSRTSDPLVRAVRCLIAVTQDLMGRGVDLATRDGSVVALWPRRQRDGEAVIGRLTAIAHRFPQVTTGWAVTFALVDRDLPLADLGSAYQEARLATEVRLRLHEREPVFRVGELGAYRLILRASSSTEVLDACARVLAGLQDRDGRGADLMATLRAYLDCCGSTTLAAARLGVHPHTVHYRLARLQELTGSNLRRPEDRLTLELAIRLMDVAALLPAR